MTIKQSIINEYLNGGISYGELSQKHGFGKTTIHRWVATSQGRSSAAESNDIAVALWAMNKPTKDADLPKDVETLQKELTQAQLHIKLLTAIIDIAEDELKIPIRKKFGTKPLKK
jgi:transposase-like protein